MDNDYTFFNESFKNFCRQEYFKAKVRTVVSDMLDRQYWQQNHLIKSIISAEVSRKALEATRKEVNIQLANKLPHQVATQMNQQVTGYLNNHHTMQQLLDTHKQSLNQSLETYANEILNRITEDPQYHEINKKYFEAFNSKGEEAITGVQQQCRQATIEMFQKTTSNTSTIAALEKKILALEAENKKHEQNEFITNCIAVGSGILGIFSYLKFSK